jgi:hypothetical protein
MPLMVIAWIAEGVWAFFQYPCVYRKNCRFYDKSSHTCHDELEASIYCGKHKEYEKY